jgi:polar amino acid transport system substrate-binding protein
LPYRGYQDVEAALADLTAGSLQAVVYDAPMLQYLANSRLRDAVDVTPGTFLRQDYAIALASASALREPINRSLIRHITARDWQDVLYRYLGAGSRSE